MILRTAHGDIECPAFLPDATRAVVRAVDSQDLITCGTPALMMSTFHLMQTPGSSTIDALGGLHAMTSWSRPLMTDSGGFQAYSLIREQPKSGGIGDDGLHFWPEGKSRKFLVTPEKSVRLQVNYGADVVICLDQCTHADDPSELQALAVDRTIRWARRGKIEFERLLDQKGIPRECRPLLFAVVQGGRSLDLRRRCVEALLEIGFDGFGFGGWPLDEEGRLLIEVIAYTRELVPLHFPFHALGVGHPESVVACVRVGCDLFDSALPTRDARRGRLYALTRGIPDREAILSPEWFTFVYVQDKKYIKANIPVFPDCQCPCCKHYTLGYLHHLFKIEDALFLRLATLHNLYFMAQITGLFRGPLGKEPTEARSV